MSDKAVTTSVTGRGAAPRSERRGFIPVREPGTNWLLFLYDPARQIIEVQRRGVKTIVDLRGLTDHPEG